MSNVNYFLYVEYYYQPFRSLLGPPFQRNPINSTNEIYYSNKRLIKVSIVAGNDFDCDCHLVWMHKLRHEAKSIKVRMSLENFICKFNSDPALNSHLTYYERMSTSNNLDDIDKARNDLDGDGEFSETEDLYVDEPKKIKADNEKTLLQIPVELLPCPAEVKSVTDRTYTYPSQNEAKDYRNLIHTSNACRNVNIFVLFTFTLLLVC